MWFDLRGLPVLLGPFTETNLLSQPSRSENQFLGDKFRPSAS